MFRKSLATLFVIAVLSGVQPAGVTASDQESTSATPDGPLGAQDLGELRTLYRRLIDAENSHDITAVRRFVWVSPNALFVAKTATAAGGNWAGFWGTEVVLQHLDDLYKAGQFRIDPNYDQEKVVGLTHDVAETYVPVNITVAYAGQTPVPRPFLMILNWIRTTDGWRMATDIALPIPPASHP
jgi:hypothetical protein